MPEKIDLIGKRYGKLTVLEEAGHDKRGKLQWKCKCDCGNIKIVLGDSLRSKAIQSCGCIRQKNISGKKYGRLTVAEYCKSRKAWRCICECGKVIYAKAEVLNKGQKKSCGCLLVEKKQKGECNTRLYRIWKGMKSRCYCKGSTSYKWYGALGIQVCEEWQKYEPFRDWANANGYTDELTIERIDVYGNYEPSNCTWITSAEQNANMRKSKKNRETER